MPRADGAPEGPARNVAGRGAGEAPRRSRGTAGPGGPGRGRVGSRAARAVTGPQAHRGTVAHVTPRTVLLAAVVVGCALLALVAWSCARDNATEPGPGTQDESGQAAETPQEAAEDPEHPRSTPREEWRKGSMPYLYQIDHQFDDVTYSNGPFAKQGCGPTALSEVYVFLTGRTDLGPAEMAEFSTRNGFSTDGMGSSWSLMSDGAAMLGLRSRAVAAVPALLRQELEQGRPLVCVMEPGTFTQVGHFIAIEGLDGDGLAIVHDSNSLERSQRHWDLSLICDEAQGIWSFSLAQ